MKECRKVCSAINMCETIVAKCRGSHSVKLDSWCRIDYIAVGFALEIDLLS